MKNGRINFSAAVSSVYFPVRQLGFRAKHLARPKPSARLERAQPRDSGNEKNIARRIEAMRGRHPSADIGAGQTFDENELDARRRGANLRQNDGRNDRRRF